MILGRFMPPSEPFFDYLRDITANAREAGYALVDLLEHFEDLPAKVERIRQLEQRGDDITHQVHAALNRTFIPPLDREDIRELTGRLDDFLDFILAAAKRMELYGVDQPTPLAQELARIIARQGERIAEAVPLLERNLGGEAIMAHIVELNRLEDEGDDVLSRALATVFDGVTDVPGVIRARQWMELYSWLEDTTDKGEDVANTIEAIIEKNA
ncbi:MAG: DUF47 domain-containing protein [Thermomicrobiaceae bacterium]|nr:DUF47 domain-containing protein [Thermomicrobiaceae bacterium]